MTPLNVALCRKAL